MIEFGLLATTYLIIVIAIGKAMDVMGDEKEEEETLLFI